MNCSRIRQIFSQKKLTGRRQIFRIRTIRTGGIFVVATMLLASVAIGMRQPMNTDLSQIAHAADPSTITACAGNPECFAFSIDTRLDASGGLTNTTATTFAIPTSGWVNVAPNPYNWIIDWGDGNTQNSSGTSHTTNAPGVNGISHTYATAGSYQIAIRPNGAAATGWFNAFGFWTNTNGANADANKYMFRSIDTPFTNLMRSQNSTYRFGYTFNGTVNCIGIPDNIFTNISTTGVTDFTYMFAYTFSYLANNSTAATIPAGLFSSIDTSSGTIFNGTFYNTFMLYAQNSTVGNIPAGLFSSINTSNGTNFYNMFRGTFGWFAQYSTAGTIPEGLFDSINTINGNDFTQMLSVTFNNYANSSTVGTIPADLFKSINTANGTVFTNMFIGVFQDYAQRTASFVVGGSVVNTQAFLPGETDTSGLYSTKIGAAGTPTVNPTVNATTGSQVVPTYDATVRSITAPADPQYANYFWYRTDGTSCAVATPTPNCGAQDSTTLVTFPDATEWIPATPTTTGNVTFYAFNSDIPGCTGTPECFAFSIDTRLTSTGATTNTTTAFSIPTSGYVGGANSAYNWIIDWGDGSPAQTVSGTSNISAAPGVNGIAHDYATTGGAGQYQITIRPAATAANGWLNAFGFYSNTTGANAAANKYMFLSIDTPFTDLMRSHTLEAFAFIFYGAVNGTQIPGDLFANISTTGDTNFSNMFNSTFYQYGYNSTSATIPTGLFDSLNTANGVTFTNMFYYTFYQYAYNSAAGDIPSGLFSSINTNQGTLFSGMLQGTFSQYARNSTVGTIPSDLFGTINTSLGADFTSMFNNTFGSYAYNSNTTIPAGLFSSINTANGLNFTSMFSSAFGSFAYSSTTGTIPAGLFSSINTSKGTNFTGMFNTTFGSYARNSTVGDIPAGLFSTIDTSSGITFTNMFYATFQVYAYNSTIGAIPDGLFSTINTGNGTGFSYMFCNTFGSYAYASINDTIPADLFSSINTIKGTVFTYMFYSTFSSFAHNSTTGTIPAGLFSSINTSLGADFTSMFNSTFNSYAANSTVATIPANLFSTIYTSNGTTFTSMFQSTFQGYDSSSTTTVGTIPAGLFSSIDTSKGLTFSSMFSSTFYQYVQNSTTGNIPAGLFDSINTSQGTNFTSMFTGTFNNYANLSTVGTIPAGLFSHIYTASGTNFSYMFQSTFTNYARNSTVGTIPGGLFGSINTSLGQNFTSMLQSTFNNYAYSSTVGTVPSDLFATINTSNGTALASMYTNIFASYAHRTATFMVGGASVNTQTFAAPYSTKNTSTDNIPNSNLVVSAGDIVVPTYDATVRTITAPTGTYTGYRWYRDASCAVPSPAPSCVAVAFPNTTEWIPATPTETGNVIFYGVMQTLITLSVSNNKTVYVSPTSPSSTAMDVVGAATNLATGYALTIKAGCAFDASGNLADGTCNSDNRLKLVGSSVGSTNPADYLNPVASGNLTDNSWGYQFDIASPGASSWLPVPTVSTTLKATAAANPGSSALSAGTLDHYNVFYGTKVAPATAFGTYQGAVVWTVVGNI